MIRVVCFILESRLNIMKESKNIVGEGNREGSEKLGQGYLDMLVKDTLTCLHPCVTQAGEVTR